jgi:hypothetical protein
MIVPVYLNLLNQVHPVINEKLYLVNENCNINAYNELKELVGFLSSEKINYKKIKCFLNNNSVNGRVWAIFQNKLLIELTNK